MPKRNSTVTAGNIDRKEAEEIFSAYAECDARIDELNAQLEQKIISIREEYTPELKKLETEREIHFKKLDSYATSHKKELFHSKRSINFMNGVLGFRIGTPKVAAKKGYTLKSALEELLQVPKLKKRFSVVKTDLNREAIISCREDEQVMNELGKAGLYVKQDERFFVELKKEEVEA